MNQIGLSDQIRAVARAKFVYPATLAGKREFSIPVRDLLAELQTGGFPARNTPQVCSALQTAKFLRENGLVIDSIDGPPSKMSTTVVVRYRMADSEARTATEARSCGEIAPQDETPSERAYRLTEKMRGLLKDELAEYGGGEAFLRWVRGYDEEEA
jgi:hypothetical protein